MSPPGVSPGIEEKLICGARCGRFYEGACPPATDRPLSRPLRPGASTSARAHRLAQLALRPGARAAGLHSALRRHRCRALAPRYVEAIETDLAWLGVVPDFQCRQCRSAVALYDTAAATFRGGDEGRALIRAYETAEELDRRPSDQQALGRLARFYDRRPAAAP